MIRLPAVKLETIHSYLEQIHRNLPGMNELGHAIMDRSDKFVAEQPELTKLVRTRCDQLKDKIDMMQNGTNNRWLGLNASAMAGDMVMEVYWLMSRQLAGDTEA